MKLKTSSHPNFKFILFYCLVTFITSIGPNGLQAKFEHSRTNFLQLNNKKSVHYNHKLHEPVTKPGADSFLQKAKRPLCRNEIEITPQPLLWKENGQSFAQLKTNKLKTSKKLWDDYSKVEGECDDDDDNSKDWIEDNDDVWDVDG